MHDTAHRQRLIGSSLRACSSKWSASALRDEVPARVRAAVASRRHEAACSRRLPAVSPRGPDPGSSVKSNLRAPFGKRERKLVSQSRTPTRGIRAMPGSTTLTSPRRMSAEHLESSGKSHRVERSAGYVGNRDLRIRARFADVAVRRLVSSVHYLTVAVVPPYAGLPPSAAARCVGRDPRARSTRLRNGGNARAHARALLLHPRPAPGRRGHGRIRGSNSG